MLREEQHLVAFNVYTLRCYAAHRCKYRNFSSVLSMTPY